MTGVSQSEAIDALRFIAQHTTDRGAWAVARRALRHLGESEAGDDLVVVHNELRSAAASLIDTMDRLGYASIEPEANEAWRRLRDLTGRGRSECP